jgi:hypothetical protein
MAVLPSFATPVSMNDTAKTISLLNNKNLRKLFNINNLAYNGGGGGGGLDQK